jgi:hypothetical protein
VPDVDADPVGNGREHFSPGPFVEGLFEIAARQTPAKLGVSYQDGFFHKQFSY